MSLIKVTSKQRDGKDFAKDLLVDLSRVAEPAFENISNETIISLNETQSLQNHVNQGNNNVQYILNETLAAFVALAPTRMFVATVVSREGRTPVVTTSVFFIDNIPGSILEDPLGSKFFYEEQGGMVPVEYIVSEDIATINTALLPSTSAVDTELGNSLFVSSKGKTIAGGALKENITDHFSDMVEALSVAASGDTIYVYGGVHNTGVNNLQKDGVEWHFLGSPVINSTAAFAFTDGGSDETCVVRGDLTLNNTVGDGFNFTGVSSVIDINVKKIDTETVCLSLVSATGTANVTDEAHSVSAAAMYVDLAADLVINVNHFSSDKALARGINIQPTFTGDLVINSKTITATPSAGGSVLFFTQAGGTGSVTINVSEKIELLGASGGEAVLCGNGNIIINGDIVANDGLAINVSQTPETLIHNGNAINDGTQPLISITGADVCTIQLNGEYTSPNANVIVQDNVNSKLIIDGVINNTNALAVAKSGVLVSANLSTLFNNVKIIMDIALGTPTSIGASAAQDVKVIHHVGTNVAADGDITNIITGTDITVDTDYE